ncbi:Ig-like domain-containing protein, partial [Hafnia paralvei]|uniref:Ig-like domain-containing protein n=1 Tax=Hafnia paralvei TaxID=546367 RepID=UPI001033BAA2
TVTATTPFDTKGKTASVTFKVGQVDEGTSKLEIKYPTVFANDIDTNTVTLSLRDSTNNAITNADVAFVSSLSGVTISSVTHLGDGIYTADVRSKQVGIVRIKATIEGKELQSLFMDFQFIAPTVSMEVSSNGTLIHSPYQAYHSEKITFHITGVGMEGSKICLVYKYPGSDWKLSPTIPKEQGQGCVDPGKVLDISFTDSPWYPKTYSYALARSDGNSYIVLTEPFNILGAIMRRQ